MKNSARASNLGSIPNSVLAALPRRSFEVLQSGLETVTLKFGAVLYEPKQEIRHVYFPSDSLISLLTVVDHHSALEVGMVGREGMVGMALTLGSKISPVRALVQGGGTALRMTAARFLGEFKRGPLLQRSLYRYLGELMAQITQTAACNRFHNVEGRLARWLLMTSDRVRSDRFELTQEFLSHMLGVRRVGVTEAASCACYALVREMNDGRLKN